MARVIDELPPKALRGKRKYPWDEWLDGRVWVVLYGEDYRCSHNGMRAAIGNAARRMKGGTAQVRAVHEGKEQIGIAFQFVPFPSHNGGAAHE